MSRGAAGASATPPAPGSLADLLSRWDSDMAARNYAPGSRLFYQVAMGLFSSWLAEREIRQAGQVTRAIVEAYQRHLHRQLGPAGKVLSVRTQYGRLKAIQTFFRWAVRRHLVPANPAADIDLPRQMQPLPDTLSQAELERILAQVDTATPVGLRDRAMLEVLWSTGLRRAEVLRLTLHDVERERRLVRVVKGKGGKDRLVPIGSRALGWLDRYLREVRTVCCRDGAELRIFLRPENGGPLSEHSLTARTRSYLRAAGIEKRGSCHLFRHAMATQLLENGCDVRLIQEMLGHSSLGTTSIYTHVSIRHLTAAHALFHPAERPEAANGEAGIAVPGVGGGAGMTAGQDVRA